MTLSLFLIQLLNGLQLGVLLFMLSAGLTLVFGIMNFVNLAHGCMYMMGAYFAATALAASGSFVVAAVVAVLGGGLLGIVIERLMAQHLYMRDHLDQVLATFGLILFFNELARWIWGASPVFMSVPPALSGTVSILGVTYPTYRFFIILVGLLCAVGCWLLISRTRVGMLIRAGSVNPTMVSALGVNIGLLNALIFSLGGALAGVAGLMSGPILSVQPGMGEPVLILVMIVIVIGGIGSIQGAFYAALMVGLIDTAGRAFLPILLREFIDRSIAQAAGPAIASMLTCIFMATVLALRPRGLFPVKNG
ncbi:MAG: branched-chain amino acid ABC transporter permease [Betaproteobacteria bacterium]|jgi:branched-chain amino acid transport system permease protein|nr:branched-chain amino acid ABC transporter permease [Betaproteobacteria bacterium]